MLLILIILLLVFGFGGYRLGPASVTTAAAASA